MSAPFGARTVIPARCAAPARSTASSAPIACRSRDACGLRYSAHGFGRGKLARSSTSTRTPARASANAVNAPAGPPPTTTTSRTGLNDARLTLRRLDGDQRRGYHGAHERREEVDHVVVHPGLPAGEARGRAAAMHAPLGGQCARLAPPQLLQGGAEQ